MLSEIEIGFGGTETTGPASSTLQIVEVRTVTEACNKAHALMREAGGNFVTFGPPIERNERGLPA